jgi:putative DNA primase/helicase
VAREEAERILGQCKPATQAHPYLDRKQIKPYGILARFGSLVIPLRDAYGLVQSLQFIDANGEKGFLSGGRVAGCFYGIGSPKGLIWLAEGFATGATIHDATGDAVAVCFSAGNIKRVAEALRGNYPCEEWVIAADNDTGTPGNPGKAAALEAARRFRLKVAWPTFPEGSQGTDFNDLAQEIGLLALRRDLEAALGRGSECSPLNASETASDAEMTVPAVLV